MFYAGLDATSLVETLSPNSHWTLDIADAVNQAGMIVGQGIDPQGKAHAYLLTPRLASISGVVFRDANRDGKISPGEIGLSGWEVYADLNNNGKLDPGEPLSISDGSGHYHITDLLPGGYTIRIVPRAGYRQTAPAMTIQTIVAPGRAVAGPSFGEVPI
jgi:hypothetical protein